MARDRSPNCPQIEFDDAIERGRKVYKAEHTHNADKLVIAKDLGYSGINGRSLSLIGALRQYGILEGTREAMHVSEDAVAYFELDEGEERRAAMLRMIYKPTLFEEMRKEYGEAPPSDANLRHWLVKRGFLSKAADDVIRVYKANLAVVNGEQSGYSGDENHSQEPHMDSTQTSNSPAPKTNPGIQTYAFALSPNARAELSLKGTITANDLEMLRNHIELTIKALAPTAESSGKDK